MKKQYQCPYEDISCDKLDSLYLTKIRCEDCEHYNKGIRYLKGIYLPNLTGIWSKHKALFYKLIILTSFSIAILTAIYLIGFICYRVNI
jgi:hypothetical protein